LSALAKLVVNYPFWTIGASLIFCAFFAWHIKELRFDTTTEGLLLSNDPWIAVYNDFLDRYGRDELILIALQADDVFTPEAIAKIKKIHKRIENEVEHISRVDSLISARDTRGEEDALVVGELFDSDPQTAEDYAAIKARALKNPFYIDRLISADATLTTIMIRTLSRVNNGEAIDDFDSFSQSEAKLEPLSDEQNSAIVKAIKKIVREEQSEVMPLMLVGSPVVTDDLKRLMSSDIQLFIKLLIAAIAVLLFAFFRRLASALYPLIVVLLSLVTMLGLMAWLKIPIKIPTQVVPAFLLAVGVGACVHLLALFYRAFDEGSDRKAAILAACSHSSFPIMMTSFTTMAGIGSFVTAVIDPFIDVGLFAPFGVLVSLILTLTLLPALLAITPMKRRAIRRGFGVDRFLIWTGSLSVRFPKTIVAVSAVALAIAIALLSQARLSHYMLGWFPKNSDIRLATNTLDEKLRGTVTLEAIIDFGEENALYDPAVMSALDRAAKKAETVSPVGKVFAVSTIIKEINRALNDNDENFYALPDSRGAIAEELLLFSSSGSADLEEITSGDYSQTRVTHKTPFLDAIDGYRAIDELGALYREAFPNAKVEITGLIALTCRALSAAVESTAISYLVAIFAITAMMIAAFGSWKLGIFSMIPNLTPIAIGMAYMVLMGIPFDMFVMLVGSIVLGLVVDDTLHFIHNFKRYYYLHGQNAAQAIEKTLLSTGRAMTITSAVLAAGFSVYLFAYMQNLVNFGLIAGVCIVLAILADFLLTPSLLILWTRRKARAF
jgi:predicted RND superfamily exporter protein